MTESASHSAVRRFVVAGLVLATVIAAVAVSLSLISTGESTSLPGVGTPTGAAAGGSPSASGSPSAAPDESAPPASGPPSAGGADPLGVRAPVAASPLPPLATGRVIDASALDRIVAGFPAIMPLAEKSTVLTSSVSSSGTRLQATVDATSELSPAAVVDFYRSTFAALSLAGADVQASGDSVGTIFSRGSDSVTLTVTSIGNGTRYSLFGALDVAP